MIDHKVFERIFVVLVIAIVLSIAAVKYYGSNAPLEGENMVDIGGYSLFIKSGGKGTPTVVFDNKPGGTSIDWSLVSAEIQKNTRTVTYDRAGLGKSEKSHYNRTSEQKAIELHTLLQKSKIKPPYIFVGSGFEVHNIRMFAAKYPKEVAGIIILDAKSENLIEISLNLIPDDEKEQYKAFVRNEFNESEKTMRDGSYDEFLTSNQQVKAHMDSIKNIPLTAIISGTNNKDPLVKAFVGDQMQLASLSDKSKVVEVPNGTPYMAYEETDLIIQEILEMINKVKE